MQIFLGEKGGRFLKLNSSSATLCQICTLNLAILSGHRIRITVGE